MHDALAAHVVRAGLTAPSNSDQANNIERMLQLLVTHHPTVGYDVESNGSLAPVQLSESVYVARVFSKRPRW